MTIKDPAHANKIIMDKKRLPKCNEILARESRAVIYFKITNSALSFANEFMEVNKFYPKMNKAKAKIALNHNARSSEKKFN